MQCENALKVLVVEVGSNLYGTVTENSDKDYIGIYIPPKELLFGLHRPLTIDESVINKDANGKNTSKAVDKTFYDLRGFFKLALSNNPNILEVFFAKDVELCKYGFGNEILENVDLFLSKNIKWKFGGYAQSEKRKIVNKTGEINFKRASNVVRLLTEAIELLDNGKIEFPLKYADVILDVKNGKYTVNQLMNMIEDLENELELSYQTTTLPVQPSFKEVDELLIRLTDNFLKQSEQKIVNEYVYNKDEKVYTKT